MANIVTVLMQLLPLIEKFAALIPMDKVEMLVKDVGSAFHKHAATHDLVAH